MMTENKNRLTFVEVPSQTLADVPIDLINDVPAPTDKARQSSLIELGQVEPVRLRPNNDRYDIVDGRRRISNAKAIGRDTVTAIIETLTDDQAAINALVLNVSGTHSPMVEARLISSLLRKYSQKDIARMLGVSASLITQRLNLLDLVPELQDRLEMGEITLSTAKMARKLSKKDQLKLSTLDKITNKVVSEKLRSYQSEMIDLSGIDIPTSPAPTQKKVEVVLGKDQIEALKRGGQIEIEIDGQHLVIRS